MADHAHRRADQGAAEDRSGQEGDPAGRAQEAREAKQAEFKRLDDKLESWGF
jgi:hypothetical protein